MLTLENLSVLPFFFFFYSNRRIHTGKRPYKCAFDGCNKYFARKIIMTKHQKQAHESGAKRTNLQWRPLNEMLISGKKPRGGKTLSWRPLDEILQSGTLLQQQIDAAEAVNHTNCDRDESTTPASPVPSEQSSATVDEDMIYSPIDYHQHYSQQKPESHQQHNSHHNAFITGHDDNWYPSPFYNHHHHHHHHHQLSQSQTHHQPIMQHHHQWLPSLCKERTFYPPIITTPDATNTPIFLNYQPFDLL